MANLKEIRVRIKGVTSTQKVTKAMKMVSAAKLRRAQDRMLALRPYASKLQEIIQHVTEVVNVADIPSKLVEKRPVNNVLLIIVTSNRGLCGPFNANLYRLVNQEIADHYSEHHAAGKLHLMCIGNKGYDYYRKRGYQVLGKKEDFDVQSDLTFARSNEVAEYTFNAFIEGRFDKVQLFYNEFKNVMAQNRIVEDFLPVSVSESEEDEHSLKTKALYTFEPDREAILSELIPKALRTQLFRAVLESNASEQGARMVAMDMATENATELLRDLRLSYNKARQAAITKEILEIAGGANALED